MEKEQREEWDTLERQAMQTLRMSSAVSRVREHALFHILVRSAFENDLSWEVCQRVTPEQANLSFAVRRCWNKTADFEKLRTPVVRLQHPRPLTPTIYTRRFDVEAAWVTTTLKWLADNPIPAYVKSDSVGLDGASYELTCGEGALQARFCWWEEPPAGWQPLALWVHQAIETLEAMAHSAG